MENSGTFFPFGSVRFRLLVGSLINEWEKVYFQTHAHMKNIIGKELINDDNVAVMELVKNSYDAGASSVLVITTRQTL